MMPRQREICLAPFPFSDEDSEKQRPVLVISNSVFNAAGEDALVMAITSNLGSPLEGVNIDSKDMDSGLLKLPSRILPTKVYSVSQARIRKTLCRLESARFREALDILFETIAIT